MTQANENEIESVEVEEVQDPQNLPVPNFNAEFLIGKAIENNLPVETMERLLAMRKELKAEWAKEQYYKAMAKFQSDCPTIVKTKEVKTKSGIVAYSYAPIESIVEQVKKPLEENGFSYSTSMEVLPAGVKVTVKITHIDGHSEVTPMEVPLGNKTDIMSASQVTAAATTFAKRYAFCNAFGILTGDEDTDAAPTEQKQLPANNTFQPASDKQLDFIKKLKTEKGYDSVEIVKALNIDPSIQLSKNKASEIIEWLNNAPVKTTVTVETTTTTPANPTVAPLNERATITQLTTLRARAKERAAVVDDANLVKYLGFMFNIEVAKVTDLSSEQVERALSEMDNQDKGVPDVE